MPVQLTLKNLAKTYQADNRHFAALSPINLSVDKEEFVCIIGSNGSGKSTLLKIIAGIEKPTSGSIAMTAQASYLPQQPSLLPWRTVEENLFLPADIGHAPRTQGKAAAAKLLEDFGLSAVASLYPRALSGGMQQKVALLRTILFTPSFLLLDEPFAALDAITRLEMQKWLLDLKQKTRSTIICVTHDIREAIFLADTIYVLSKQPARPVRKFPVTARRPCAQHQLSAQAGKIEEQLYELLVDKP